MANPTIDWAAIDADPGFRELHARKIRFLWGLMAFSVVYYFLLPIGAAYFTDLYRIKVWGPINVGLLFALSQFLVAWGIAFLYARKASQFDAMAEPDRPQSRRNGRPPMNTRTKTFVRALVVGRHAARRRAGLRAGGGAAMEVPHLRGVRCDHRPDHVCHLQGGEACQDQRRLLCRRRRGVGSAERLGDRRRLPVGRLVPGHRRPDLAVRLRRVHVLGGLAGGLHHRAAGDCRALPQHRQVHHGRHPRLPQQSRRPSRPSWRSRPSPCPPFT